MPRKTELSIKESASELKKLHAKHQGERNRKRIRMLIKLKSEDFIDQSTLADELQIGKRTLERWLQIYRCQGIIALLAPIKRNRSSSFIDDQIHQDLECRLNIALRIASTVM